MKTIQLTGPEAVALRVLIRGTTMQHLERIALANLKDTRCGDSAAWRQGAERIVAQDFAASAFEQLFAINKKLEGTP